MPILQCLPTGRSKVSVSIIFLQGGISQSPPLPSVPSSAIEVGNCSVSKISLQVRVWVLQRTIYCNFPVRPFLKRTFSQANMPISQPKTSNPMHGHLEISMIDKTSLCNMLMYLLQPKIRLHISLILSSVDRKTYLM